MDRRRFIKNSILMTSGLGLSYCGAGQSDDKVKIIILGFDGAGWPTIDPLIEQGKLPYLKKFMQESAWGDFKTIKPTKSNVVWTTIATGKTMLKHGIMDFSYLKKNGIKVPFTKSQRKEPAIWQILNSYNKSSVVINWWVSHPPDKVKGVILSDHFRRIAQSNVNRSDFISTVHPPSFFDKLEPLADENRNYFKVLKRTGLPDFFKRYNKSHPGLSASKVPVLGIYKRMIRHDGMIDTVSRYLHENTQPDLFATYFRFPDITQHFITHFMDKAFKNKLKDAFRSGTVNPELLNEANRMVSELIYPLYRYMEDIIRYYVESEKNKNTYFFIMSDHGFSFYDGGYNHYDLPEDMKAPDGIFLMRGPKVRNGKIDDVSVFDVAPTVLNILDLPVGKNMDGKVLRNSLKLNNRLRYKEYGMDKYSEGGVSESFQKEELEELKSIGYI